MQAILWLLFLEHKLDCCCVLQERFSTLEIKRRWRSVAVPFGVVRWFVSTCWSSTRRRVRTCVKRSMRFYSITISGTMPGIIGKRWKILRFTEYDVYITKSSLMAIVLMRYLLNCNCSFHTVVCHILVWNWLNQMLILCWCINNLCFFFFFFSLFESFTLHDWH